MNYLTHFLADHQKNRPLYNFGLALPDLLNVSKRGWKPDHSLFPSENVAANEIWEGFKQHIASDAYFHNTALFTFQTKRLRKELEQIEPVTPGIRLFFVAHILLEMLLDRHILKTRPAIAGEFYENLDEVSEDDTNAFFAAAGIDTPERFFYFFGRFREAQYLYSYLEDNGIFKSVNRLLERTGQPRFPDEAENEFNKLVRREGDVLFEEFESFLLNYEAIKQ